MSQGGGGRRQECKGLFVEAQEAAGEFGTKRNKYESTVLGMTEAVCVGGRWGQGVWELSVLATSFCWYLDLL